MDQNKNAKISIKEIEQIMQCSYATAVRRLKQVRAATGVHFITRGIFAEYYKIKKYQ